MEEYHGIIVDVSQIDKSIFDNLKILGKKKDGDWIVYKIRVKPKKINELTKKLQNNLKEKFYFHFYRNNELTIVFRNKIFEINTNKDSWKSAIDYGKDLGISAEQLDFYPCKITDEEF